MSDNDTSLAAAKRRLEAWLAYDAAQGGVRGRTAVDPYEDSALTLGDDLETVLVALVHEKRGA